jgi:glycosyltransferase involved in cell wall biosynthesis
MSDILKRLKNLTRINRRRIDTTLLRVHRNPVLMLLVNLFFLSINFFVRIAMVVNRLLEKTGLRTNEHLKASTKIYMPLPTAMSARTISDPPAVLLVIEESIPQCFRYRVQQKLEQFDRLGWKHEWVSWRDEKTAWEKLHFYDVIIFYRVPGFPAVLRLMEYASALNKLMVYDLDDLIFDQDRLAEKFRGATGQLPGYEHKAMLEGAELYRRALETCDYAIASTPSLAAEMSPVTARKRCEILANALDKGLLEHLDLPKPPADDSFVDIFYGSGTKTHDEDFASIAPALKKVLEENEHARLVIVGHLTIPGELAELTGQIVTFPIMSFDSYLTVLSQAKIAIAPLEQGIFADCKSEIKWIEAALFGIPSVVTPTQTYRDVISDEEDGCFATDTAQWYAVLNRLLGDKNHRESVGRAAHQKVLRDYGLDAMSQRMENIIHSFIEDSVSVGKLALPGIAKKKILYVNTVYPPFAVGGATVVMKNIIDEIRAKHSDDYEVSVFTCDGESPEPYQLHEYEYEGVNVTALSVPASPAMEWNYADDEVERVFTELLQARQPDIVHFHSMQRLTASPLYAAEKQGIPSFVTVHDAWWISDHQFLIDENNNAVDELQRNPLVAAKSSHDIVSTLERSDYLAGALNSASRILAVSDYQAGLYRKNGFSNVYLNKNGVSMPAAAARETDDLNCVRLAYLGGICTHKGYYFLKDVYSRKRFEHLALQVIDFDADTARYEQWGENPVQIIQPFGMEQAAEFYSDIDVIVAPSMWPESFGLVSREALLMGKWVVASEAGGLAEDISKGVNGLVYPLGDAQQFFDILEKLNANPETYKRDPRTSIEPRVTSVAEQVVELDQFYRELLAEHEQKAEKP